MNRILSLTLKNGRKIYLENVFGTAEFQWSYDREDALTYSSTLLDDRIKSILKGTCLHVFIRTD